MYVTVRREFLIENDFREISCEKIVGKITTTPTTRMKKVLTFILLEVVNVLVLRN